MGDYDVKDIRNRLSETKRNFYSSQRFDLSKPINFFPGPGAYFEKDRNEKTFRNTFS